MPEKSKNRVFLSYARENLYMVRRIYIGLKERKIDVWFDKEDLGPGLWKRKIEKAIPKSRYFIICISEAALKKTGDKSPGFQDEELQQAYEIARVQPEDLFTIVPVRLENCGRGDHRLSPYQQYDLFNDFEAQLDNLAVNIGGVSLADKLVEDTRTDDEKMFAALYGKAATFYYAGDFGKTLDVFTSILILKPDDAQAWQNKGSVLSNLDRYEEAIEAYDRALEIRPDFAQALCNKGNVLFALGLHEGAIDAYDKALTIQPDYAQALHDKGSALSNLGRRDEAIEAYNKALTIQPDEDNKIALVAVTLRLLEEILGTVDKALGVKPDHPDAWRNKIADHSDLDRHADFDEGALLTDACLLLDGIRSLLDKNREE